MKKIGICESEHFVVSGRIAPHMVEKNICVVLLSKCIVCCRGYLNGFAYLAIVGEQCERFHEALWQVLDKLLRNLTYFDNFNNQAITQIFVNSLDIWIFTCYKYNNCTPKGYSSRSQKLVR